MERIWYIFEPWVWNSVMGTLGLIVLTPFVLLMRWLDRRG